MTLRLCSAVQEKTIMIIRRVVRTLSFNMPNISYLRALFPASLVNSDYLSHSSSSISPSIFLKFWPFLHHSLILPTSLPLQLHSLFSRSLPLSALSTPPLPVFHTFAFGHLLFAITLFVCFVFFFYIFDPHLPIF